MATLLEAAAGMEPNVPTEPGERCNTGELAFLAMLGKEACAPPLPKAASHPLVGTPNALAVGRAPSPRAAAPCPAREAFPAPPAEACGAPSNVALDALRRRVASIP
mmetsp:Transcript_63033/g.159604  ORF Transcript_63033/g.159604 Transcript_63033/m.159604 type:complete len:106 (+) Transcript_63033:550-867(+)